MMEKIKQDDITTWMDYEACQAEMKWRRQQDARLADKAIWPLLGITTKKSENKNER